MADLATIARPYAEALFSIAKPADLQPWLAQLHELAQVSENRDIAVLANNPKLSSSDLGDVVAAAVKTPLAQPVLNFLKLLSKNHRLQTLPYIAKQFEEMKNRQESAAEIVITSAFPLEGEELKNLLDSLKKRFGGKELRPKVTVDPELIGGVSVRVGDEVLDGSIRARLSQLQNSLGA